MSPGAGAHGELCGMMAIRAALEARGERARRRVLVPESAHGTNPATAAELRLHRRPDPGECARTGRPRGVQAKARARRGGIMVTNPNTCGLFEPDIVELAEHLHESGAYFYCDGANFNAIVGRVRPGDLGVDCMHINLHKTFSTPAWRRRARERARGASRRPWPPSRPCPGSCTGPTGSASSSTLKRRGPAASPSAGSRASMARWACSSGRSPT